MALMTVMELDLRANPMRIEHRVIPQARQVNIIELRSAVTKCANTSWSSTKENVLATIAKAVKLHSVVPIAAMDVNIINSSVFAVRIRFGLMG